MSLLGDQLSQFVSLYVARIIICRYNYLLIKLIVYLIEPMCNRVTATEAFNLNVNATLTAYVCVAKCDRNLFAFIFDLDLNIHSYNLLIG